MNPGIAGARILVIDDEPQIRRLLTVSLSSRGYAVHSVGTGREGLEKLANEAFDVVLLDLGLPDMEGLEVCNRIRGMVTIPVIVISVREGDADKVTALDLGADDYVTKPFSIDELLARIRANLRRVAPVSEESVIRAGDLELDPVRRRVARRNLEIHLTPTEYDLLHILARHKGRVLTHRQLLRVTRGPSYEADTPLLRVHMVGLRQKMGLEPQDSGYIATEPGVGYRMLD